MNRKTACLLILVCIGMLIPSIDLIALAQGGVSIGGQDNSAQVKDVQNVITTLQTIGFKWVAKLIGGFLVIMGVYKIAVRDFFSGILSTAGGGTLFFVEKIADALSRMSGGA